jgi:HAD superfamily hydrolase (TIGR01509 family)
MKKWVFFDFDGVIIDSETVSLRSWRSLLKDPESISIRDISGNSAIDNAKKLRGWMKKDIDIEEIVSIKLSLDSDQLHQGFYPVVDGVNAAIMRLSEKYNLAVVTSNSESVVRKHLAHHDLERFFPELICATPSTPKKPDPGLYLEALRSCRGDHNSTIAIEDSAAGIAAARAADVRVIGFGDAVQHHEGHCHWLDHFGDGEHLFETVEQFLI